MGKKEKDIIKKLSQKRDEKKKEDYSERRGSGYRGPLGKTAKKRGVEHLAEINCGIYRGYLSDLKPPEHLTSGECGKRD